MKNLSFKCLYVQLLCFILSLFFLAGLPLKESAHLEEWVYAADEAATSARAMCVMDMESRRVLYNKNMHEKLPMASTTKIITAITVIENCTDLDGQFTVSDCSVGVPGTSIYLTKGEELSCRELLYGLMLVSGNDAATALACHVGGDVEGFVSLMNETAEKAGALNSHFVNPHGLDADGHYTTAEDLVKITSYALNNATFKEIVCTRSIKINGNDEDGEARYLKNKNRLLGSLKGCVGVKTGYTGRAGRCYVGALERGEMTVVCAVLNCGPMFEEAETLMTRALESFERKEILPDFNFIRQIPVEEGRETAVKVYSRHGFCYPLTKEEVSGLNFVYDLPSVIKAPIKNDSEIGKLEIYLGNELLFSEKVYTMEEVRSISVIENIKDIIEEF